MRPVLQSELQRQEAVAGSDIHGGSSDQASEERSPLLLMDWITQTGLSKHLATWRIKIGYSFVETMGIDPILTRYPLMFTVLAGLNNYIMITSSDVPVEDIKFLDSKKEFER